MKTVEVDGQIIVVVRERPIGNRVEDNGLNLRYFVEEADGTYSSIGEGYSDKAMAQTIYDKPDDEHLLWVVDEARRQTIEKDTRPPAEIRPPPTK